MDHPLSTKPPKTGGDEDPEAAAADAAFESMLALLSTHGVVVHDDLHVLDEGEYLVPRYVVTDKSTDERHCPDCSRPTRVRLRCGRRGPTTSPRKMPHSAFLQFEWGHAVHPYAVLDLWFMQGAWAVSRISNPDLVNWPGLTKLEALVGGSLPRYKSVPISEDVAAKVALWFLRAYQHHATLESLIGTGPRD